MAESHQNAPIARKVDALLVELRAAHYGDPLTELEMLLIARNRARVKSFEWVLLALLVLWALSDSTRGWHGWLALVLILGTGIEALFYRSRRKTIDAAIAIFVKAAPKTLDEARRAQFPLPT